MEKIGASKRGKGRLRARIWCAAGLACTALFFAGCGAGRGSGDAGSLEEGTAPAGAVSEPAAEPETIAGAEIPSEIPGQIVNGIFESADGRFTVQADEEIWEVSRLDGPFELRLSRYPACFVTFQESGQITPEQTEQFETVFAPSYAEALKADYPDARIDGIYTPRSGLSGMAVTMTDRDGQFGMRQLFYLAADEQGGCLMTAILPETDTDHLKEDVQALMESFSFQNSNP